MAAAMLTLVAACGKKPEPTVDAAAERAAATERAKQGPYGTQMKALETAKGMEADINKKVQDAVEKTEK
jgi:hypothetical protein